MELLGNVKTYDWGKLGSSSKVATLAAIVDKAFVADEDQPYSELWMGDHVSGPSKLKATGESLSDYVAKNPAAVGGMQSLPFLLKVLSIRKALSLQVHPNKVRGLFIPPKPLLPPFPSFLRKLRIAETKCFQK